MLYEMHIKGIQLITTYLSYLINSNINISLAIFRNYKIYAVNNSF